MSLAFQGCDLRSPRSREVLTAGEDPLLSPLCSTMEWSSRVSEKAPPSLLLVTLGGPFSVCFETVSLVAMALEITSDSQALACEHTPPHLVLCCTGKRTRGVTCAGEHSTD